jgi:hypothetical protein
VDGHEGGLVEAGKVHVVVLPHHLVPLLEGVPDEGLSIFVGLLREDCVQLVDYEPMDGS